MDSSSKKFRQAHNITLSDSIVCTASSPEFICAASLDDTLRLWKNDTNSQIVKQPILQWSGSATGIIDAKFSPKSTHLAVSSMDSFIRIWELEKNTVTSFQCPVMSAWKIQYVGDSLAVCGDLGRINFYDLTSKESTKKIQTGEVFLTSLAKSNTGLLATGNSFGDVYIINLENKNKAINLKPHFKSVKSLAFTEDSNKLLTASEDSTIKVIDVSSEKVISSLEGHKQTVSCVKTDLNDSRISYSCSFDKSLKSWDMRMKCCIDSYQTGSPLWSLEMFNKNIYAGGENGVLSIFSLE